MAGTAAVALAATAFVGSHFALSHPCRRPLVAAIGEGAFTGLYSVVAAVLLGCIAWAYQTAPTTAPLWPVGDTLWAIATVLMLGAAILLAGSLVGNPVRPGPVAPIPDEARGVFAVTRHPMLWSFAIWGACHVLVYPVAKNIVVAVAMTILSLVGAGLQDRKRAARDPAGSTAWQARTSFVPFGAIAAGRARFAGFGVVPLGGGLVLWLLATWAHIPLAGWPAGIWRWIAP